MKLIIRKFALKSKNVDIATSVEGAGRFNTKGEWETIPVHKVAFVTIPEGDGKETIVRAKYLSNDNAYVFTYIEDDVETKKTKETK